MKKRGEPYEVGRGKPPIHSRFPKGASGNPNGRPKKVRPGDIPPPHQPFTMQMILESAFAPVTLTNPDGSTEEITSVEAVLRALKVKAIKGNSYAQNKYLDLVRTVETERVEASTKLYTFFVELKMEREVALTKWVRSGRREEDFPCHPEDIHVDPETLRAEWRTPVTLADHENLERVIKLRDSIAMLLDPDTGLAGMKKDFPELADEFAALKDKYDEANSILPPRFQKVRPG